MLFFVCIVFCNSKIYLNTKITPRSAFRIQLSVWCAGPAISTRKFSAENFIKTAIMSQRKFFVGGNWKMNGNKASIDGIIKFMNDGGCNPNTGLCAYERSDMICWHLLTRWKNRSQQSRREQILDPKCWGRALHFCWFACYVKDYIVV